MQSSVLRGNSQSAQGLHLAIHHFLVVHVYAVRARLAWVLTLTLTLSLPLTLTLTLTNPHPNPIFKKMYVFSPICTPYICGAPPRVSLGMRAYPVVCPRERAGSP